MKNEIKFTRVKNDINGNPRYVCHFLNFITDEDKGSINEQYEKALKRARKLGGKKFHNKQYGGGIIFQSYNISNLENEILKISRP